MEDEPSSCPVSLSSTFTSCILWILILSNGISIPFGYFISCDHKTLNPWQWKGGSPRLRDRWVICKGIRLLWTSSHISRLFLLSMLSSCHPLSRAKWGWWDDRGTEVISVGKDRPNTWLPSLLFDDIFLSHHSTSFLLHMSLFHHLISLRPGRDRAPRDGPETRMRWEWTVDRGDMESLSITSSFFTSKDYYFLRTFHIPRRSLGPFGPTVLRALNWPTKEGEKGTVGERILLSLYGLFSFINLFTYKIRSLWSGFLIPILAVVTTGLLFPRNFK